MGMNLVCCLLQLANSYQIAVPFQAIKRSDRQNGTKLPQAKPQSRQSRIAQTDGSRKLAKSLREEEMNSI